MILTLAIWPHGRTDKCEGLKSKGETEVVGQGGMCNIGGNPPSFKS